MRRAIIASHTHLSRPLKPLLKSRIVLVGPPKMVLRFPFGGEPPGPITIQGAVRTAPCIVMVFNFALIRAGRHWLSASWWARPPDPPQHPCHIPHDPRHTDACRSKVELGSFGYRCSSFAGLMRLWHGQIPTRSWHWAGQTCTGTPRWVIRLGWARNSRCGGWNRHFKLLRKGVGTRPSFRQEPHLDVDRLKRPVRSRLIIVKAVTVKLRWMMARGVICRSCGRVRGLRGVRSKAFSRLADQAQGPPSLALLRRRIC